MQEGYEWHFVFSDGHIFIFASFQFGQKTADSPLGSAIELYFVQLYSPVHVAAWVDDLIFIMSARAAPAAVRSA